MTTAVAGAATDLGDGDVVERVQSLANVAERHAKETLDAAEGLVAASPTGGDRSAA